MSHAGGYCPNCEQYVSPPLLPLDYYQCNNCMMTIHADDLVRKRSMAMGGGGVPRSFDMGLIGYSVLYDGAQIADTVNVSCNYNTSDWLVVIVSTVGANQHPSSVAASGTSFIATTAGGTQSHARTSIWYGKVATGGSGVTVFWTGQHPHGAVVTVMRTSSASTPLVRTSAGTSGQGSSTSSSLGSSISPTDGNSYAIYAVNVEGGRDTIGSIPNGYTLVNLKSTGQSQQPVDTEQAVCVQDLTSPATIGSVSSLTGSTYYAHAIVIVGKS